MLIFLGVIAGFALLAFLVGLCRAVWARDRRGMRRAVGALVGQLVLLGGIGVPMALGLVHYGVLGSST
jgi:hypothetical protein